MPDGRGNSADHCGDGGADLHLVGGVSFCPALDLTLDRFVGDYALAGATVELEGECAQAFLIGLTHVDQFNDQNFILSYKDGYSIK